MALLRGPLFAKALVPKRRAWPYPAVTLVCVRLIFLYSGSRADSSSGTDRAVSCCVGFLSLEFVVEFYVVFAFVELFEVAEFYVVIALVELFIGE
eukprot:2632854-Amphidinium_carterae.1